MQSMETNDKHESMERNEHLLQMGEKWPAVNLDRAARISQNISSSY